LERSIIRFDFDQVLDDELVQTSISITVLLLMPQLDKTKPLAPTDPVLKLLFDAACLGRSMVQAKLHYWVRKLR
jgi:hypothetical protein